jgi:hypothetical protein
LPSQSRIAVPSSPMNEPSNITEFDPRAKAALLAHLPHDLILRSYAGAPGKELESGKFASPESSAALAANVFGFFLSDAETLEALPRCQCAAGAKLLGLEVVVRFPWTGGRHPCLDALVDNASVLIGVESKRYEPFRGHGPAAFSKAYSQHWGHRMRGYEFVRDSLKANPLAFEYLDAAQLVKHAFGLRTAGESRQKHAVLYYVYAEPRAWPDGRLIPPEALQAHREEVERFAILVADDQVSFRWSSYSELLTLWATSKRPAVREHAQAIAAHFDV